MSRTSVVALLSGILLSTSARAQDTAPAASPPPTPTANPGEARAIGVDEAVKMALDSNPQLASTRFQVAQIQDQSNSLRGRMLPVAALSNEYQHYNDIFAIPFGPEEFKVQYQDTNTFVAALGQPVTGLLHLMEDRNALEATALSVGSRVEGGEAAIREAVQSGYLRFFEAKAREDIAKTSEAELHEQEELANVKLKAGVLTKADVLRLDVAAANAKQQEIQAKAQEDITRSAILTAIGLSPADTGVTFVEPTALEEAPLPSMEEHEAQSRALTKRPEAVASLHDFDAATYRARSEFYQLLPDVNLEAAFINVHGSPFAEANSGYVGVKASWNIWEWGATWYQLRAAEEAKEAASANTEDTNRSVRVDASTKLFQAKSAGAAVESAQAAIASAEESYRVSAELVRVGSATTTQELLDSQTQLTQAKLNLVTAKYEQAIATVALKRSIGE